MAAKEYFIGFDVGSSSVKASLLEAESGAVVASATSPDQELPMQADAPGWAEQHPDLWWEHVVKCAHLLKKQLDFDASSVKAIGISYQMHGLVLVDQQGKVLRPSIIWCDSRAVNYGKKAFEDLGAEFCLSHYLNSPGNFTASKLKWVKENEPQVYSKIHKMMLPGDYIAYKLTGEIKTTFSGLSEGIMWDFKQGKIASELLEYYGISPDFIPDLQPSFSIQGHTTTAAAKELGLVENIPVTYRAGDQPNNALSLNVLEPGEVAATAGTSGVVYGIIDKPAYDQQSRVNTFIHVNHEANRERYGVLLCLNGTGIQNSWLRNLVSTKDKVDYDEMNQSAMTIPIGADQVLFYPFGNGAERILENKDLNARIVGLNFNRHQQAHLYRAAQEGIVYALNYGFQIMKAMGMPIKKIRAGNANMFLSPLFREAFANVTGASVELYNTDGAQGAARGAGIGLGYYSREEAFKGLKVISTVDPDPDLQSNYQEIYGKWQQELNNMLKEIK